MRLDLDGAKRALDDADRQAARPRSHAGGRRHPAHRHDQDVPHGALGDDRARARRRRLHAGRLWRRRAAARRDGRARAAHRQGRHPARAGAFLRLRHAGRRPAARFRQHLVQAARRRVVRRDGGDLCRHGTARPRGDRRERACDSPTSPCSAPPTCAMSARSTPSPSNCRSSCSSAQDRDGIKQRFDAVHETRYGYSAPSEKAEIVSLRGAVTGADAQAGVRAHRRGRRRAAGCGVPRHAAGLFRRDRTARRHADLSTAPALLGRQSHRRARR